jgi:hypothetical protein
MTRAAIAEARAFESWHDYQEALTRAIAPLTEEQLQHRLLPELRTPGEIAEHVVFGRALHLHRTLGEQAAELTPLLQWDDATNPPRTAAEIVQGLELTWQVITDCLMRGSSRRSPGGEGGIDPDDLGAARPRPPPRWGTVAAGCLWPAWC